ncbi:MAG: flagellar biosynthesis protein FlhB [Treponema sp.]|nr:flagellar biosynthesis protein FlhB [Treponema sp.]
MKIHKTPLPFALRFLFSFPLRFTAFVKVFLERLSLVERGAASRKEILTGEELYHAASGMDLQWFAAEDEGRTHEPTEVTYRKAREEGRVAKSQEFIAALGLLLPTVAIILLAPWILQNCVEMLRFFFTRVNELDPLKDRLTFTLFITYFARLALPIFSVALVAALFSNLVQTGFLFTTKPLTPDFSRVLPKFGRYFQRTLFSVEGLYNFAKSIFKLAIIGTVAYLVVSSNFKELANLQTASLWTGVSLVASLAARLLIITALLLLFLSIPDILFQRWQFRESLKMTREAAKEELKQEDGDPDVRRRLRSRYREILSRNMLNAVPNADVVITNPTHYSVALEFDVGMTAPTVVAKGEDELALRIREVAKENGIPVVPHPPLTRTLYNETEVGDEIPIRYWNVVALVVGKFFNYEEKLEKARRSGRGTGRMGA